MKRYIILYHRKPTSSVFKMQYFTNDQWEAMHVTYTNKDDAERQAKIWRKTPLYYEVVVQEVELPE